MKHKRLALELELIDLDAEREELDEALEKNNAQRQTGRIIALIGIFLPIIVVLLFRAFVAPMILFFVFVVPLGLFLLGRSERITIKQKMKEHRAKVREVKKSLLQLKYEE